MCSNFIEKKIRGGNRIDEIGKRRMRNISGALLLKAPRCLQGYRRGLKLLLNFHLIGPRVSRGLSSLRFSPIRTLLRSNTNSIEFLIVLGILMCLRFIGLQISK